MPKNEQSPSYKQVVSSKLPQVASIYEKKTM